MPRTRMTAARTGQIADDAAEAIRTLNLATHPGDGSPGLAAPADACYLLGAMHQLVDRLPQLLVQLSAFLQRQLQQDVIAVDGGEFYGDPLGAVGTASHHLEASAIAAARSLATALDAARAAIAYAGHTNGHTDDSADG
jgi:hypothetical protein